MNKITIKNTTLTSLSVSIRTIDGKNTTTVNIPKLGSLDILDNQMSGDLMTKINNKFISITKIVPDMEAIATITKVPDPPAHAEEKEHKHKNSRESIATNKKEND